MIQYCTVDQIPSGIFAAIPNLARKAGNNMRHKRIYKDAICAFDIEASRLTPNITGLDKEQSIMYLWQFCILDRMVVIGRTWEEFKQLLEMIDSQLMDAGFRTPAEQLVVWVHNLSYEFQFLAGLFDFGPDDVFCIDSRRVLKANLGKHIELRCSYLHSNMSLELYCKKMHTEHQKLSGDEFDYREIRYPWTPLSEKQILYGIHDVLGLCEAIKTEMDIEGDDLYTIPLTSTGYVRRDIKRAMHTASRTWLKDVLPPLEVYELLREEFRGGNTHANRYFSAQVLDGVKSADRSSSYPGVQMNHLYPMGRWNKDPRPDWDIVQKLINKRHRAIIARFSFENIRLKNRFDGCPYLSIDKSRKLIKPYTDNGRILSAAHLETTLNDVDLGIVSDHYCWDAVQVTDLYYCAYYPLPDPIKDVIRKYYRLKTELKYDQSDPRWNPETDTLYTKSKNKLNAIYGCSAQRADKQSIKFVKGEYIPEDKTTSELLEQNYKKAFFSYAWGAWCTAWARYELQQGIDLVQNTPGAEFIYCDTDSVKYVGDVDWSRYNKRKIKESTKSGAYADDPKGVRHYMECYEPDGEYLKFATLGAKKYAFEKPSHPGETMVTIAGVTKSKGGKELDKGDKYGSGIERFADIDHPFLFVDAGGTEALYNDNIDVTITIDGKQLHITRNVVIRDSTYLLGITGDYRELIDISLDMLKRINPMETWVNDWHSG